MNANKLLRFSKMFYALAASEEIPADSKDLKIVLKNIENLETYQARKKYAEKNLEHLSSGSSRIVYKTSDGTVIKMAKNDRGLAQNQEEIKASSKYNSKYLNKVIRSAKNYSWMEVPYLEKITEKNFKDIIGVDFNDFGDALRFSLKKISENIDQEKPEKYSEIIKLDLFKEINKLAKDLNLMPGDLARISSYGIKEGRPILADFGLTKKIYEYFYEDSTS